jgi:hypothetical protein
MANEVVRVTLFFEDEEATELAIVLDRVQRARPGQVVTRPAAIKAAIKAAVKADLELS